MISKKVDTLSGKLMNGDIQVIEIPDELFIPVAKRTIYNLPARTMEIVAARLSSLVDHLKGESTQYSIFKARYEDKNNFMEV